MSLGLGAAMTLLGFALSSVVASFFDEPQVQELFWLASLGFTINSLSTVPGALLTRDLAYRSLELRQIAGTVVGSIVAVALALAGAGPWAIVANSVAAAAASTGLLWILTPWRPRFAFSRESYRNLGGFGIRVYGSQLLQYFQLNADNLLIGRYLGAAALGSYAFAYNLMVTPLLNIAWPIQHVVFPAFATIQHDHERLRAAWLRGKRLALAIMAPAFLLLAVVGPDLIPLLFGPNWNDSIRVLQLLCLAGLAYSIGTQNQILLMVRNRVRTMFWLTLAIVVITVGAIVVGLAWGIVGVAAALAVTQWALVAPETWVTTRAGRMRFWETLFVTCSPLPFAFAAAAAGYAVRVEASDLGVPAALRILLAALTMLVVYVALIWVGSRPLREEAKQALAHARRRLGRRQRGDVALNSEA
jgi:O-antigen/teichoic acid export membrane protein